MRVSNLVCLALFVTSGCATAPTGSPSASPKKEPLAEFKRAEPPAAPPQQFSGKLLVYGATIMTATGQILPNSSMLVEDGIIAWVKDELVTEHPGATAIDARGKFVTPGLIDTHSHMGVYPFPEVKAHHDGNEMVGNNTAEVRAEHGFWPGDPALSLARAGGITTIQVLPGSANLIGGQSFTAKLRPQQTHPRMMRFAEAPVGLKMACGENPKRVHGPKGGPMTRMGNAANFRRHFQSARAYARSNEKYERDKKAWSASSEDDRADPPDPPKRDLRMEALSGVLDGSILVHLHCYRADDIHTMMDIAEEFGFSIRSVHHGLEAYKLAPRLAQAKTSVSTWSDWWGFKIEAYDGIPQNVAILTNQGVRAIIHSDSAIDIQRLNHEAAKAVAAGKKIGLEIAPDTALRWVTMNPAWALGIDKYVGSLEAGKHADFVIWNGDPLSVYARAERVFINGDEVYSITEPHRYQSDFELGQPALTEVTQ